MTDARDTGEHFLGALEPGAALTPMSARRVADLTTQIDFLDREVARYRELLEHERIRHSTELADLQLDADTKLDALRRAERIQTQQVHDRYRSLLSERQIEFEQALSAAAAASAAELQQERRRHESVLEREQTRRDAVIEASRKQTIDEINQAHQRKIRALEHDLAQATLTIERLQAAVTVQIERATAAESLVSDAESQRDTARRDLHRIEAQFRLRIDEADKRASAAMDRLEAERQRSAATLAELLERSATIAAEADKARSDFAAQHARAEHAAATAHQQATAEYKALADAADERAARAIQRETALEAVIAGLRAELESRKP